MLFLSPCPDFNSTDSALEQRGEGQECWDPDRFRLAAGWAQGIPLMGDGAPRDPGAPAPTSLPPTQGSLRRERGTVSQEACRDSVRNVGWGRGWRGGEEEPRGPSPWDWSRVGGKR